MCVVPAGVHDMDVLTFIVFGDDLAGVRQTSVFFHWQRIHICAYKHCRPVAIFHHSYDAVPLSLEFSYLPTCSVTWQPAARNSFTTSAAVRSSYPDSSG